MMCFFLKVVRVNTEYSTSTIKRQMCRRKKLFASKNDSPVDLLICYLIFDDAVWKLYAIHEWNDRAENPIES